LHRYGREGAGQQLDTNPFLKGIKVSDDESASIPWFVPSFMANGITSSRQILGKSTGYFYGSLIEYAPVSVSRLCTAGSPRGRGGIAQTDRQGLRG
jgi:hypothetical protein